MPISDYQKYRGNHNELQLMNGPKACKIGYLGSYHVDIPFLAGFNEADTATYYLKKAQLYQGHAPGVYKGPLSTFMAHFLNGKEWMQIILTLNHITTKCKAGTDDVG